LNEIKKDKKFQLFVDYFELDAIFAQLFSNKQPMESIHQSAKSIKIISLFYFLKSLNYI
jgi:hypothetical protein